VLSTVPERPPTWSADAPGNTIVATTAAMTSKSSLPCLDMARGTYNRLIAPPQVRKTKRRGTAGIRVPKSPDRSILAVGVASAESAAVPEAVRASVPDLPAISLREGRAEKAHFPFGFAIFSKSGRFRTVGVVHTLHSTCGLSLSHDRLPGEKGHKFEGKSATGGTRTKGSSPWSQANGESRFESGSLSNVQLTELNQCSWPGRL